MYVFELTVVDTEGINNSDRITITVNPSPVTSNIELIYNFLEWTSLTTHL